MRACVLLWGGKRTVNCRSSGRVVCAMLVVMLRFWTLALLIGATGGVSAQQTPASNAPSTPPLPAGTPPTTVRVIPPHSPSVVTVPSSRLDAANRPKPTATPTYRAMEDGILAWDSAMQETSVTYGTVQAFLQFNLINISTEPVTITAVRTSCGCTVPKLPPLPWKIEPGSGGPIDITMNLAGKTGNVIKSVTVTTDHGYKSLAVRANIEAAPGGMMGEADRQRNLALAMRNRQAVFQGSCASCHATPALNKMGAELYTTACGICHEAEHRGSMVPDLNNLQKETNADYWRTWITSSAEGKLMPAFAIEHGGILNQAQIESLVEHMLNRTPVPASAPAPSGHSHP